MNFFDIIEKKKHKKNLTAEESDFIFGEFAAGNIKDSQMSAFLMAQMFCPTDKEEAFNFTMSMVKTGETIDLSALSGISADKHSTGGIGDKTTLILAPVIAALGIKFPKLSGRGLGYTGGTIDKLESIPGFKTDLTSDEVLRITEECGCCIAAQTDKLVPADKLTYALRSEIGAVDNQTLIAASVMSKKIAVGADIIVLDIKYGSGAFMKTRTEAVELGALMRHIGEKAGKKVSCILSDMNVPLGINAGNALEVFEAVQFLKGGDIPDLYSTVSKLAVEILMHFGCNAKQGLAKFDDVIKSGAALQKFRQMVKLQGGDLSRFEEKYYTDDFSGCAAILSPHKGKIIAMDTEKIGEMLIWLKAGRSTKTDSLNYDSGICFHRKTGDDLLPGDEIGMVYYPKGYNEDEVIERFLSCFNIN
ncbi:MAG: thymidine phosphorylase [Ruminococcus sp.]|jgi:pyrimidine-nucleoside phosphorylase|nr:thymidine phosphorylase [Ruminococcus sp.]